MRETINNTIKIKNRIFAIPAALLAIPPNPKTAAMIATIKNKILQRNICLILKVILKIQQLRCL